MAIRYRRMAEEIEKNIPAMIQKGELSLPSEKKLGEQYSVSRQTVREALALLEEKGYIVKKHGSGSYLTGLYGSPEDNRIAVLVDDVNEYIYPRLLEELRSLFLPAGFTVMPYSSGNDPFLEREVLKELLPNPPRALLIQGSRSALPTPNEDLLRQLQKKGTGIVFLFNRYRELSDCPCIWDDNIQGSLLLVEHLRSLGHEKIAAIFKEDDLQGHMRYKGYVDAMLSDGLTPKVTSVGWYNSNTDLDLFLEQYLAKHLGDSTAIICYNDGLAYRLTQHLDKHGFVLPDDLAVVSFDNTYLSSAGTVNITTLSHKPHAISVAACQTILNAIKKLPAADSLIPWDINRQESSLGS